MGTPKGCFGASDTGSLAQLATNSQTVKRLQNSFLFSFESNSTLM